MRFVEDQKNRSYKFSTLKKLVTFLSAFNQPPREYQYKHRFTLPCTFPSKDPVTNLEGLSFLGLLGVRPKGGQLLGGRAYCAPMPPLALGRGVAP